MCDSPEAREKTLAAGRVELVFQKVAHQRPQIEVAFFLSDENVRFNHVARFFGFFENVDHPFELLVASFNPNKNDFFAFCHAHISENLKYENIIYYF